MATKTQRLKAVLDGLANTSLDPALIERIATQFAAAYQRPDDILADMTDAEKAARTLHAIRTFVRETVVGTEIRTAQETARTAITPPDLGDD